MQNSSVVCSIISYFILPFVSCQTLSDVMKQIIHSRFLSSNDDILAEASLVSTHLRGFNCCQSSRVSLSTFP